MKFGGQDVRIRKGRSSDYECLVEMQQDGPFPIDIDDMATILSCDSCLYVAECAGHACGWLLARLDVSGVEAKSAVLHRLYVAPAARRIGIGSALLRRLANRLSPARPSITTVVPLWDTETCEFLKRSHVSAIKAARLIPHHRSGADLVFWSLSPRPHLIKFRKGSMHAGYHATVGSGVQHSGF